MVKIGMIILLGDYKKIQKWQGTLLRIYFLQFFDLSKYLYLKINSKIKPEKFGIMTSGEDHEIPSKLKSDIGQKILTGK